MGFDSTNKDKGEPKLIIPEKWLPGLCEALQLMREGDKWQIFLSAELGYGINGGGPIPGGTALIYEVHLLGVDDAQYDGPTENAGGGGSFGSRLFFRAVQVVLVIARWAVI